MKLLHITVYSTPHLAEFDPTGRVCYTAHYEDTTRDRTGSPGTEPRGLLYAVPPARGA